MAFNNTARASSTAALDFGGEVVRVLVDEGPNEKSFFVYETLICARSEYFKRALNGSWSESDERKVTLPEVEAGIFALYLNLIYRDHVPRRDVDDKYINLAKIYVLCERVQDTQGKNAISEAMLAQVREQPVTIPGSVSIEILYEGTPENSPVRKLVVDMYVELVSRTWLGTSNRDQWPKDFLFELSVQLMERCTLKGFQKIPGCAMSTYHEKAPVEEKRADGSTANASAS